MMWTEENVLLNTLSYWSGSAKARRFLGRNISQAAVDDVIDQGLSHIAIDKKALIDDEQMAIIKNILAPYTIQVYSNDQFDLYQLEAP